MHCSIALLTSFYSSFPLRRQNTSYPVRNKNVDFFYHKYSIFLILLKHSCHSPQRWRPSVLKIRILTVLFTNKLYVFRTIIPVIHRGTFCLLFSFPEVKIRKYSKLLTPLQGQANFSHARQTTCKFIVLSVLIFGYLDRRQFLCIPVLFCS